MNFLYLSVINLEPFCSHMLAYHVFCVILLRKLKLYVCLVGLIFKKH